MFAFFNLFNLLIQLNNLGLSSPWNEVVIQNMFFHIFIADYVSPRVTCTVSHNLTDSSVQIKYGVQIYQSFFLLSFY